MKRPRAAIDAVTRLLMKHESFVLLRRQRGLAFKHEREEAKVAAEDAAKIVLTMMLRRTPTPEEVELTLWG